MYVFKTSRVLYINFIINVIQVSWLLIAVNSFQVSIKIHLYKSFDVVKNYYEI